MTKNCASDIRGCTGLWSRDWHLQNHEHFRAVLNFSYVGAGGAKLLSEVANMHSCPAALQSSGAREPVFLGNFGKI